MFQFILSMQLVILCATIALGLGFRLEAGPDPLSGGETGGEKELSRRNIPFFYSPVYNHHQVPVYRPPQIIAVHHIVYLQQPDPKCLPARNATGPPVEGPAKGLLDDRFGEPVNKTAQPSRCVWAIVSCCAPGSRNIRYTCFELLGCEGAFWEKNPCEANVVMAAANTALNFYMTNGTPLPNNNIDETN